MPAGAPPKPFQFPKAATRTLGNGLRVFVIPSRAGPGLSQPQPAVTVRLVLAAGGSIHHPAGSNTGLKAGVAAMTANLLTQGTAKRSAQQIAEAIDSVGGVLSATADSDATYLTATVVKRDLDLAMDLLSDIVEHAAFPDEELERRRQQLLSDLRIRYADPEYMASVIFDRVVYGAHPYGLPDEGTPDSVQKLTRGDLVRFRDTCYVPNQALLAFAGDISPEVAFTAAEKYFGAWPRKPLPGTELVPPRRVAGSAWRIFLIDKKDAVQTQIRVGRLGVPRNSPDYLPLLVTNRIFGGGFNSRLSTEVRIRKGLTYGAFSQFESRRYTGSFVAATSTRTEATVEATRLVATLLGQMATGAVKQQELNFARDYLVGVFPIQSETAEQVAGRILTVAHYDLPADYNDTYRAKVGAVGAGQVQAMAARYFALCASRTPSLDDACDLALVLVGNVKEFRDALRQEFPQALFEEIPLDEVDLLSPSLRRTAATGRP
jgi:zinc protease